jgi:hypothetical protein
MWMLRGRLCGALEVSMSYGFCCCPDTASSKAFWHLAAPWYEPHTTVLHTAASASPTKVGCTQWRAAADNAGSSLELTHAGRIPLAAELLGWRLCGWCTQPVALLPAGGCQLLGVHSSCYSTCSLRVRLTKMHV